MHPAVPASTWHGENEWTCHWNVGRKNLVTIMCGQHAAFFFLQAHFLHFLFFVTFDTAVAAGVGGGGGVCGEWGGVGVGSGPLSG